MNEVVIEFNRMKRVRNLFITFSMFLVFLCAFCYLLFNSRNLTTIGLAMVGTGSLFFVLVVSIKNLFSRDKAGMIINSESIHFKGTILGRKVGKITWDKVERIYTGNLYNSTFIFLKLKDDELFRSKCSKSDCEILASNGVPLANEELSISFDKMKKLIELYYNQYKANTRLETND